MTLVTIKCCGPDLILWIIMKAKLCPFGDTQPVMEILQHAFDTLMHLFPCVSRWVEANSGFRVSDFLQLAQPTEDAHQLLRLHTMGKWRLGGWVCVFMTPSRSSPKKGDKVILPVSSFFALAITFSHTRGRRKGKKLQWQIARKGRQDNKLKCNRERKVACVCRCVFSACVHMLISQIGDDDTQQAKINSNLLWWHLSAWSSH